MPELKRKVTKRKLKTGLTLLSSEEEEQMLKKLQKKNSDTAKDNMRYGALIISETQKGFVERKRDVFQE